MSGQLLTIVVLYLLLVAALAVMAAAGIRCNPALRAGVVIAEVLLLAQLLVDVATLLEGRRPEELATHLGYAMVSVVLFPILITRPVHLPARSDHLVTAVAAGVAIVVSVRMHATLAPA